MKEPRFLLTYAQSAITLELIRGLKRCGAKIFVTETHKWHISRFSNSVEKSFVTPSPRFRSLDYIKCLAEIIEKYEIDILVPMWEDVLIVAKHRDLLPKSVMIFADNLETLDALHHKGKFIELMRIHQIPAIDTIPITSKQDLEKIQKFPIALKACYSRASQAVFKIDFPDQIDKNLQIDQTHPWIAQNWVEGENFCTFSIVKDGHVLAHTTYPVEYSVGRQLNPNNKLVPRGSACVAFRHIRHEKIEKWVIDFVKAIHFTGQIAFDLVVNPEGHVFAVECNPRMTSGASLVAENPNIIHAFLKKEDEILFPPDGTKKQLGAGMMLFGWKSALETKTFWKFLRDWPSFQDVVFNKKDIKPFLMQFFVWANLFFSTKKQKISLVTFALNDQKWNGDEQFPAI